MSFDHIAVFGAGAWGSALANLAAQGGHAVTLWARDPAKAAAIQQSRENPRLPGARLHERVKVTSSFADAASADAILLVVPAQALRSVAAQLNQLDGTPVIACAKGIERSSHKFMTEVIAGSRAKGDAGNPVRTKLCRRRRTRAAYGSNACRPR